MKITVILALIVLLITAGCIRGNVPVKNETRVEVVNETILENEENQTTIPNPITPTVEETKPVETKDRYFPWNNGFKDLKEFSVRYFYVKSGSVTSLTYVNEDAWQWETGILRIWFKGNKARIDRYEVDYIGEDNCDVLPLEFMEYNGKQYALIIRENYGGTKFDEWRYTVLSKGVTGGEKEIWKCETKKTTTLLEEPIDTSVEVMKKAYNVYANRFATPHYYTSEEDYDLEAEKTKEKYEIYGKIDGARLVRETNALKQREEVAGRKAIPFYTTKTFGNPAYGYELIDKELGLGLAFYLKNITNNMGGNTILPNELLVYNATDFSTQVNDAVFE